MSEKLKSNYEVCEEIGRGRYGVVFRCVSVVTGKSFACKSIDKRRILDDSIDSQCLTEEVKAMRCLSGNPNIVQLFDVYEDDENLHVVMDLCSSPDLYDRVTKRTFTEPEAAVVMVQLLQAIAHMHRCGYAHRDVKAENILFDSRNRLKLADFGSAIRFRDGELMSGVVGTPYYVAPEVVIGREYTEKVDVWSCGVVLYIMIAGIPPFYGENAAEIFEAVVRANLRFPTRIFGSVSPAVKDLLRKMICKDVDRRFSAEQVLRHPWMTSVGETNLSPQVNHAHQINGQDSVMCK